MNWKCSSTLRNIRVFALYFFHILIQLNLVKFYQIRQFLFSHTVTFCVFMFEDETIEDVEPIDLWEEEDEDAKPEVRDLFELYKSILFFSFIFFGMYVYVDFSSSNV